MKALQTFDKSVNIHQLKRLESSGIELVMKLEDDNSLLRYCNDIQVKFVISLQGNRDHT
jgi:hypothetical protein